MYIYIYLCIILDIILTYIYVHIKLFHDYVFRSAGFVSIMFMLMPRVPHLLQHLPALRTEPPSFTNDDLETAKEIYKPLMPQGDDALDKTLVQGGSLGRDANSLVLFLWGYPTGLGF